MTIYKILTAEQWTEMQTAGRFEGSDDDRRDGFIHLSAPAQVEGTLARHFADVDGLVVLAIDDAALGQSLKWERSRGGALFPHLYAPLMMAAVTGVQPGSNPSFEEL